MANGKNGGMLSMRDACFCIKTLPIDHQTLLLMFELVSWKSQLRTKNRGFLVLRLVALATKSFICNFFILKIHFS